MRDRYRVLPTDARWLDLTTEQVILEYRQMCALEAEGAKAAADGIQEYTDPGYEAELAELGIDAATMEQLRGS